jgi:hypothetical protein
VKPEDQSDGCKRAGLCGRRRHAPRRARVGGHRRALGCGGRTPLGRSERPRLRSGVSVRSGEGQRGPRLGDRGHRQLRRRPCPLPRRPRRDGARDQPYAASGAALAWRDDSLDAARTARAALGSETLALPRSGERREALRLLLVARRSALDVRRAMESLVAASCWRRCKTMVWRARLSCLSPPRLSQWRIAEGKSRRDATRLLKRYLARRLYRLLQKQEPLMA